MKSGKGPPPQGYGKPPAQLPKAEAAARDSDKTSGSSDPEAAVRLLEVAEWLDAIGFARVFGEDGARAARGREHAVFRMTCSFIRDHLRALAASPEPAMRGEQE